MLLKLKIIKVNNFNEYILKDKKEGKEYSIIMEFYGIDKPKVNDIIALSDRLVDPNDKWYSQPYAFELLNDTETNLKQIDVIGLISKDKKYILKRIYG